MTIYLNYVNPLHPRLLVAKFGWNWPSGFEEEDENMTDRQTDRQTGRRQAIRKAHQGSKKYWGFLFVCFWVFHLTGELFTHMETWPLPLKDCKFWPMSSEGSLAFHIYCVMGQPFIMVISEDPWHSQLKHNKFIKIRVYIVECLVIVLVPYAT